MSKQQLILRTDVWNASDSFARAAATNWGRGNPPSNGSYGYGTFSGGCVAVKVQWLTILGVCVALRDSYYSALPSADEEFLL